jgi:DMSO/TMAO reductase YedYZ molybdopterin-dependent catalytic subunit
LVEPSRMEISVSVAIARARLDPAGPYVRHPLRPHQLRERVTRTEDVIVLCHLGVPQIAAEDWSLSIDGMVRRPTRLTLRDLLQKPRVTLTSIHQCCGSPFKPRIPTRRVCNIVWGGVRLADILAECEPDPSTRYVWSTGQDHGVFEGVRCEAFTKDLPIERAAADVLIAYEMNGAPLRPEHGYPARLVVPGYYGTNSVKWLSHLTLADRRASGPFTTRWYNDEVLDASGRPTGQTTPVGPIAPESIIVSPAPDQVLGIGTDVEIWGWAWADGGVSTVEIAASDGPGNVLAKVEAPAGRAWQRFHAQWRPQHRGSHELRSRAASANGLVQPDAEARNAVHHVPIAVL